MRQGWEVEPEVGGLRRGQAEIGGIEPPAMHYPEVHRIRMRR
jgi:hypothetical protein